MGEGTELTYFCRNGHIIGLLNVEHWPGDILVVDEECDPCPMCGSRIRVCVVDWGDPRCSKGKTVPLKPIGLGEIRVPLYDVSSFFEKEPLTSL